MAFVVGTGRAFEQPSVQSVLPNIVPAERAAARRRRLDLGVADRRRRRPGARRFSDRAQPDARSSPSAR